MNLVWKATQKPFVKASDIHTQQRSIDEDEEIWNTDTSHPSRWSVIKQRFVPISKLKQTSKDRKSSSNNYDLVTPPQTPLKAVIIVEKKVSNVTPKKSRYNNEALIANQSNKSRVKSEEKIAFPKSSYEEENFTGTPPSSPKVSLSSSPSSIKRGNTTPCVPSGLVGGYGTSRRTRLSLQSNISAGSDLNPIFEEEEEDEFGRFNRTRYTPRRTPSYHHNTNTPPSTKSRFKRYSDPTTPPYLSRITPDDRYSSLDKSRMNTISLPTSAPPPALQLATRGITFPSEIEQVIEKRRRLKSDTKARGRFQVELEGGLLPSNESESWIKSSNPTSRSGSIISLASVYEVDDV